VEKLNATGVTYDNESAHQQRLLIGLENTGTQLLHPSGSLQVRDETGHLLQRWSMKLRAIIPQTSIQYPVYILHHALNAGTYTATLHLDYEYNHTIHLTTTFVVPLLQLQKNSSILPRIISPLVAPNSDVLYALTPWHYVAGIGLLVLLLSTLCFWGQRLYKSTENLRRTFHDKRRRKNKEREI
jgi:hypothetical protein